MGEYPRSKAKIGPPYNVFIRIGGVKWEESERFKFRSQARGRGRGEGGLCAASRA